MWTWQTASHVYSYIINVLLKETLKMYWMKVVLALYRFCGENEQNTATLAGTAHFCNQIFDFPLYKL